MSRKFENPRFTAEEWLTTPEMGVLSNDLDEQEENFTPDSSVAEVSSALFARGANPRDNFLAPGEYHHLVSIIENEYPNLFALWIEKQIEHLEWYKKMAETGRTSYQHEKVEYYKELKASISEHPRFSEVSKYVAWK